MFLKRINPQGIEYRLEESPNGTIIRRGPKSILVDYPIEKLNNSWFEWIMDGFYIQVAFDYLTDDEREFLMTGILKEEWDRLFRDTQ